MQSTFIAIDVFECLPFEFGMNRQLPNGVNEHTGRATYMRSTDLEDCGPLFLYPFGRNHFYYLLRFCSVQWTRALRIPQILKCPLNGYTIKMNEPKEENKKNAITECAQQQRLHINNSVCKTQTAPKIVLKF